MSCWSGEFVRKVFYMFGMASNGIRGHGETSKIKSQAIKIMPVFYRTSLDEFKDLVKRNQLLSQWHELSLKNKRINVIIRVGKYFELSPSNKFSSLSLGEVNFWKVIVNVICEAVPPKIRLYDLHIQGKSCMCKVRMRKCKF